MMRLVLSVSTMLALSACTAPALDDLLALQTSSTSGDSSSTDASTMGGTTGTTSVMTSSSGSGSASGTSTTGPGSTTGEDSGHPSSTGSTGTTAAMSVCGDGAVGGDEECDDGGNDDEGDGCTPDCLRTRWAFVTAAEHSTDLNGIEGSDSLCRQYALQSGRAPDTWKNFVAWVSGTTSDVRDRLGPGGPWSYARTDGVIVARGTEQLFSGTLEAAISVDEFGVAHTGGVITGTRPDGTAVPGSTHCDDWTIVDGGQFELYYGNVAGTDSQWTMVSNMDVNPTGCAATWRIYCIEGG